MNGLKKWSSLISIVGGLSALPLGLMGCGGGGGGSIGSLPPPTGPTPVPPQAVPTPVVLISEVSYQPQSPSNAQIAYIYAASIPGRLALDSNRQPLGLRSEQIARVGGQSQTDVLTETDPDLDFRNVCEGSTLCTFVNTSRIVRTAATQLTVNFSATLRDILGRVATASFPSQAFTPGVGTNPQGTTAPATGTLVHAYFNPAEPYPRDPSQLGTARIVAFFRIPAGIRPTRSIVTTQEIVGPTPGSSTPLGESQSIDARNLDSDEFCSTTGNFTGASVCTWTYFNGPFNSSASTPGQYTVRATITVFDSLGRSTAVTGTTSFAVTAPPTPVPGTSPIPLPPDRVSYQDGGGGGGGSSQR